MPHQKFKYDVRAEDLGVPSKLVKRKGDFFKIILRYFLFLAVLGLHCYTGFSPVAASGVHSPAAALRLLLAESSLVAELGLGLGSCDAHGPCCSPACGIFPDQGSNLCLLHGQVDSVPLSHQESPGKGTLS